MKKIIMEKKGTLTINFEDIDTEQPIFCKRNGKLIGMIVNEGEGWIIKVGDHYGINGHHSTLRECIENGKKLGDEFYIN